MSCGIVGVIFVNGIVWIGSCTITTFTSIGWRYL